MGAKPDRAPHAQRSIVAARIPEALVRGANVVVIAVGGRPAYASCTVASVCGGAGVAVVAKHLVGCEQTPDIGTARIICAEITIITRKSSWTSAHSQGTNIARRTGIPIVTWNYVWKVDAARIGIAGVIGAETRIVTVQVLWAGTESVLAGIPRGTGVAIIALDNVVDIDTADIWVARIVSANVLIVTIDNFVSETSAITTEIRGSAGIAIVTWKHILSVNAARLGVT